jgi:hypothetical protein
MISEDVLERGLAAVGDSYEVPPGAAADIVDQLRPAETDEADHAGPYWRPRPSRRTWLLSAAAAAIVLVIVAFVVGGNGGNGSLTYHSTSAAGSSGGKASSLFSGRSPALAPVPEGAVGAPSGPGATGTGAVAGGTTTGTTTDSTSGVTSGTGSVPPGDSLTKVEKTGELALQVDKGKVGATVARMTGLAKAAGGYVSDSQSVEGSDPTGEVTVRVPVDAFERVVGQARGFGKVLSLDTKGVDVTASFVDLQARQKSLAATRETYLKILSRASTIGEILSVQQRVNDIQTQIEQVQGQLKVLTDRTSYGTLTVTIDQKTKIAAVVHHEQSGMSRAVHRSVSRFVHGIEAIIGVIGPIVLVLLLLGVGWLLARVGYRVVRRQLV